MSRSNERPGRLPGDGPRYGERREGRSGSSYRDSYRDRDQRGGGRGYRDRDDFGRGGRERRPYGDRDDARRGYGARDRNDQRRPGSSRDREGGRRESGRGRDERGYRPEGRGFRRDDRGRSGPGDRSGGYRDREGGRREFRRDRDERSRERGIRPFSKEGYREREKARSIRARYGRTSEETAESPTPSPREQLPEVPPGITPDQLDKEVRAGLFSLPKDLANLIAVHLVAAERALAEDDAERAYEHTKVARRFGSRVGVVREAAGIAAYRAGRFAEALHDLRAARRLMGADDLLPLLADCERGLGRPERALDLIRSAETQRVGRAVRVELAIVESGARRDLGQKEAAVVTLQRLPELRDDEPHPWSARLAFAYADALADAGQEKAAADWFYRAMSYDEYGETDAAVRYAELTGTSADIIEDVEEEADDEDGLEPAEARDDIAGDAGAKSPVDVADVRAEAAGKDTGAMPEDDRAAGPDAGPADTETEAAENRRPGEAGETGEAAQDAGPAVGTTEPGAPTEAEEPDRFVGPGTEAVGEPEREKGSEAEEAAARGEAPPADAAEPGRAGDAPGAGAEAVPDAAPAEATEAKPAEDVGASADHAPGAEAKAEPNPENADDQGDRAVRSERPEGAEVDEPARADADAGVASGKEVGLEPAFIEPDFGGDDPAGTALPGKREAQT